MTALPRPTLQKLLIKAASSRFFLLALLLHLLAIIGFGSAVLFDAVTETPEFVAQGGSIVTATEAAVRPPETLPSAPSSFSPAPPKMEPPSMSAITSASSAATSFTLPVQTTAAISSARIFTSQTGIEIKSAPPPGSPSGEGGSRSFFGESNPTGAGLLAGTFYDLKQDKRSKSSEMNSGKYAKLLTDFVTGGWNTSDFSKFFRSPKQIFTGQVLVPEMDAKEGPKAFGMDEDKVKPSLWVVLYKGRVSPPESGTYHFVGAGDDVLFVRFNNQLVLERCWNFKTGWKAVENYRYGYTGMPDGFAKGDAIPMVAGQFYPIEILVGEQPGGKFFASLLVEKQGATYKKHSSGAPILPVFRVSANKPTPLGPGVTQPPYEMDGPVWKAAAPGLGENLGAR